MRHNHANEGGGAIFFVSNDRTGRLHLRWSTLKDNVSARLRDPPRHLLPRPRTHRRAALDHPLTSGLHPYHDPHGVAGARRRPEERPGLPHRGRPRGTVGSSSSAARRVSARPRSSTGGRGSRLGGPRGEWRVRRLDHPGSARPAARDAAGPARAASGPDGADRADVFLRLSERLGRPGTPYLLVIEDAHWADDATLDLVRHLARRVHRLGRWSLVTTAPRRPSATIRCGCCSATWRRVRRTPDRPEPALAGRRARAARGARIRGRVRTRRRRALRTTARQPVLRHRGDRGRGRRRVPRSVREAVLSRTARLSDRRARRARPGGAGRSALRGRPGRGPGSRTVADALDEALGHGVLAARPGKPSMFRHELARLTVLDEIPALRRRADHGGSSRWLEAHEGGPGAAWPTTRRRPGRTEAARDHSLVAAERAASLGSHHEAVEQYQRALRHTAGVPDPIVRRAARRLAYELYVTGRIGRGVGGPAGGAGGVDGARRRERVGDAQRWMSRLSWFLGDQPAGRGVRRPRLRDPGGNRRDGRGDGGQQPQPARDARLRPRRHPGVGSPALDPGRRSRRPEAEEVRVHALNNLGTIEVESGDREEGWRLLEESLRRSRPLTCTSTRRGRSPTCVSRPCSSTTTCAPGPICRSDSGTAASGTSTRGRSTCAGQQALSQLDQG